MAQVPITIICQIYPKDKTVKPYPANVIGFASITGLEVGGGPILPPDQVPPVDPPLVIWGAVTTPLVSGLVPIDPYPDIGPPMPQPPIPPTNPPTDPVKPHEGWNWSAAKSGWYYLYVPAATDPAPKRK